MKINRFFERGWYFSTREGDDQYMVWASQHPLSGDSPVAEDWSRDIYFEFGETEDDALVKLKAEVFGIEA